jgi:hypothetical protein
MELYSQLKSILYDESYQLASHAWAGAHYIIETKLSPRLGYATCSYTGGGQLMMDPTPGHILKQVS